MMCYVATLIWVRMGTHGGYFGYNDFDIVNRLYILIYVIKTGPWSNKIKQMRKQNIEDTQYKRDKDLHGSPSVGYVHQRNCQVLPLLLSII
jgi:hypothetical protein